MASLTGVSTRIRRAGERSLETTGALQRLVWRRLHPHQPSAPMFIIGCNRSGTTMLTFQLARSWQILAFNENDPEAFERFHLRELDQIGRILAQGRAPWVVFKPVLDTYRGRHFVDRFPDSRVVFAYRNLDDVVNSVMSMALRRGHRPKREQVGEWVASDFAGFKDPSPPTETRHRIAELWHRDLDEASNVALFWLFQNALYFDLGLVSEPRVRLVRYEQVVTDPPAEFRSICDFLRIRYEPRVGRGVHRSSIGKETPPRIEPEIRSACAELIESLDRSRLGSA